MAEMLPTCPQCGSALPSGGANGVCPSCLMQACLKAADEKPHAQGSLDAAWLEKFGFQPTPGTDAAAHSFGDYELLEEIARGGMGVVYKARQKSLNRFVAVKMILAGQFADKQAVQRFRGEAAAAGTLHHPHIVTIHEIGMHEGRHFLSLDYVEGQNLAQLVGTRPLPARQAARYVEQVAQAIHYAHQQGILHRDLKPSNVLIEAASDEPRVTDFGLAKRLDSGSSMTAASQVLGSPNFMPPEQASAQRGKVGRHSDVYGLGGILYYTLTARAPFSGTTLETAIHEVLHTEPISLRALNPSVPRDLETICLKCLEKEPGKRYASARELAEELSRFLRDEPIQARPVNRLERAWRWCRRNPTVASLGATTAVSLVAVAVVSTIAAVRLQAKHRAMQLENYAATIAQASRYLRDGERSRAMDLLLKCPADLRHWEWGRLMYLCHQDILTIPAYTNVTPHPWDSDPVVRTLAFDAEGMQLVTLGSDGVVKVWALADGRLLRSFGGPTNRVGSVVFHPKEPQLALGCSDGRVRIWNTMSWRELPELSFPPGRRDRREGALRGGAPSSATEETLASAATNSTGAAPAPSITLLGYSVEGKELAAAASDQSVTVWELPSNRELFSITPPSGEIESLFFTTDGQRLVTKERLIARIWNADTGQELFTFDVDTDEYRALFVHPQGDRFATIDGEERVKLWSGAKPVRELGITIGLHPVEHRRVFFSPDGRLLCTAGERTTARICDAETGEELMVVPERVHRAVFSPDSRTLVTLGAERVARVWDVAERLQVKALHGHESLVETVAFSLDGRFIATASHDGIVKLWNAGAGREVLKAKNAAWAPAFSPDGRRVTIGSWWHNLSVWDTHSGKMVMTLKSRLHFPQWLGSVFSPDGRRIISAGNEKVARLWDADTGQQLAELRGHGRVILSVAHSSDGRRIATASLDRTARIWDAATYREILRLEHPKYVDAVAFDPVGKRLLTTSGFPDSTDKVRVWDVETGQLLLDHGAPGRNAIYAGFSPDGSRIVALCEDKKMRVLNAQSGALLHIWPIRGSSLGLSFSPDGQRLIVPMADFPVGGFDVPMAELWDAEHGRQLLDLQGHTDHVGPPVFSPDGRRIFTVSMDSTGRLWETFPWRESEYPGAADFDFPKHIQLYARKYWRERLAAESAPSNFRDQPDAEEAGPSQTLNPFDWPARDSATPPELIDLTPHYNAGLDSVHLPVGGLGLDDDLERLPHGTTTLRQVAFDVRGVMTLRRVAPEGGPVQQVWNTYPIRANGIRMARKYHRLHVLHAACVWPVVLPPQVRDGAVIGSYVWHFADGSQREFEIVYGRDVRDWWKWPNEQNSETDRAQVVWEGTNPWIDETAPGVSLRLYLSTYENPQPGLEVTSIDFVSKMTQAAPFLVAMTVEP